MTPERIKQFIKYEIIFVFALYAFAGGNAFSAVESGHSTQQDAYNAAAALECSGSKPYLVNPLSFCAGCIHAGSRNYAYFQWCSNTEGQTSGTGVYDTTYRYQFNLLDTANFNPDGSPITQAPDISTCPDSVTWTRSDNDPLPTEIRTADGCVYTPDWQNTPITGCYEKDPPDPNEYYCRIDATPTDTFDPTQETGETQPETDGTPKDTTTQSQRDTADAISDWWGSEPTQTYDFPDGRRINTYESSTGCVLEVVINPDGTYGESQDTCNVHNTDGSTPTLEPDENHTNPDGTPNTGGGSGNTGSPSGGGTSGGGDTGGGDTGGGDTGGGDTGGGDTGGGDTGGGDTGTEEPTTGEDKSGEILDWLTEPFTPEQHPDTPVEEIDAEQLAVDWSSGLGSGSCPAPVTTTFQGQTIPYDLTDACMAATSIFKPVLLAIAAFAATFIIAGVRT